MTALGGGFNRSVQHLCSYRQDFVIQAFSQRGLTAMQSCVNRPGFPGAIQRHQGPLTIGLLAINGVALRLEALTEGTTATVRLGFPRTTIMYP